MRHVRKHSRRCSKTQNMHALCHVRTSICILMLLLSGSYMFTAPSSCSTLRDEIPRTMLTQRSFILLLFRCARLPRSVELPEESIRRSAVCLPVAPPLRPNSAVTNHRRAESSDLLNLERNRHQGVTQGMDAQAIRRACITTYGAQ